jgi:FMN-dependent NADH-azoreductase
MSNILVIDSAVSGDASVSRVLVREAVDALRAADPSARVTYRDLGLAPVPHLTSETLAGVRGEPATAAERATRALSDALIDEIRAADVIVIGAPMYNFSVPTGLRAWFDHVLRPVRPSATPTPGPRGCCPPASR